MICHSRPIHSSRRVIYEKAPGQQRGKWAERGMGQRRHRAQTGQRRGWVKKRGDRQPSRGAREEEICSRSQCESVVWSFVIWGGYPSWGFLCLKGFSKPLSLFFWKFQNFKVNHTFKEPTKGAKLLISAIWERKNQIWIFWITLSLTTEWCTKRSCLIFPICHA